MTRPYEEGKYVASRQRERDMARAHYERQQARRAAQVAKRQSLQRFAAVGVVVAVVVGGLIWVGMTSGNDKTTSASSSPSASASTSGIPVAGCTTPSSPGPANLKWDKAPATTVDPAKSYAMTLTTNCGKIEFELDAKNAPETVNSMIFLANQKYFDNTPCHRLTTSGIFVLQCGDPTGSGTGGPGYQVKDENLPKDGANNYPAGTLAMANSGANTNGSQFFIVYKDTTLGPNYTIWGKVKSGLDIVQKVAAAGVSGGGGDGAPAQPVSILTATTAETFPVG